MVRSTKKFCVFGTLQHILRIKKHQLWSNFYNKKEDKKQGFITSSCMYTMCTDALFPVSITLSGPYPPQMTRISFNRWWITILWDEEGGASLFL